MSDDAAYSGIHSKLTREEIAEREIGKTAISRPLRIVVVALFLVTILLVAGIQHVIEIRAGFADRGHWVWPKAYDIVSFPGHAWTAFKDPEVHGLWARLQAANNSILHDVKIYEKEIKDDSFLARASIPHTQAITAEFMGLGNEEVYLGRDGWLFYQPEVAYLSGEGFLAPDFLKTRARKGRAGEEMQPDPLKAIIDFRDQLKARGIQLLLLPAPVKPMIEPEHLSSRYGTPLPIPLQNPSYAAFLKALDAAGVDYLDVSSLLADEKKRTGQPQYLLTDTHWRPETMELAVNQLAEKIRSLGLSEGTSQDYVRGDKSVTNLGDIALMLRLPASSTLYPRQTVSIHPVSKADGSPWAADPASAILVLGDSFCNIYSLEGMGWGKSAGLVEQLSYDLRLPIDAILRNDAGAYATRAMLAKDLAQGHDRLAGKRLVVWEFAMRELSVGDWKMIGLPQAQPEIASAKPAGNFYVPADGGAPVRVTATIDAASKFPQPGSVPYKDHVFALSLSDVTGPGVPAGSRAVVYLWSMRNNVLTKASEWKAGDHVTLELKSWNDVSAQYDRFNRSELDDDSLQLQPPCWAEPVNQP